MEVIQVDINKIRPYENNPRLNDNAVEKVAESIRQYGFNQPIVCDKNMVIIVGHTRYKAAKLLGLKSVPVYVAGELDEQQAKAYRIADNKVSDFSIWDNQKLMEELDGLDNLFTGFDLGDVFGTELCEKDNAPIAENEAGVVHEVVFKSGDIEKIRKIIELWESEVSNGGGIGC